MEIDHKDVTVAIAAGAGGKTAKTKKAAAKAAAKTVTTDSTAGNATATMPENPDAADPKGTAPSTEKAPSAPKKNEITLAGLVKEYAKLYPKNPVFHVSSDRQVFLNKDKRMAELHQKSLGDGGTLTSIKA